MGIASDESLSLFRERLRESPFFGPLREASLAVLVQQNYIQYDGTSCAVIDTTQVDLEALWKEWDRKKGPWLEDSNKKARVVLVEAMLRALPEILSGKRLLCYTSRHMPRYQEVSVISTM